MKSIQADIIVELANGPIGGDAYGYLVSKGKTILPDIIANAGGVIVSYLEWLQNRNKVQWTEKEVNDRMAVYIKKAVRDVYEYSIEHDVSLKEAGFDIAIQRLV